MPRRLVARLFLFVWLALLGIEFVEQAGWFVFPDQAVDDSVDAAVVTLGIALKESPPEAATAALVFSSYVPLVQPIVAVLGYSGVVPGREPAILGPPPPICKLHCTFLI
ncbi:MAG TPA: hypothetical protein VI585_12135 [Candidatus Binatia bacterium]